MTTPHIAAAVGDNKSALLHCPPHAPYSTDPVDWARAFLFSGDWRDDVKTLRWFTNAMSAANPDLYAGPPEIPEIDG